MQQRNGAYTVVTLTDTCACIFGTFDILSTQQRWSLRLLHASYMYKRLLQVWASPHNYVALTIDAVQSKKTMRKTKKWKWKTQRVAFSQWRGRWRWRRPIVSKAATHYKRRKRENVKIRRQWDLNGVEGQRRTKVLVWVAVMLMLLLVIPIIRHVLYVAHIFITITHKHTRLDMYACVLNWFRFYDVAIWRLTPVTMLVPALNIRNSAQCVHQSDSPLCSQSAGDKFNDPAELTTAVVSFLLYFVQFTVRSLRLCRYCIVFVYVCVTCTCENSR